MTAMWDKKMETQPASTKIPICFDSKKRVNIYTLGYVPHTITAIFFLVSQAVPSIPDAHRAQKTMFSWQTLVYDVSKILLMDELPQLNLRHNITFWHDEMIVFWQVCEMLQMLFICLEIVLSVRAVLAESICPNSKHNSH